MKELAKGTGDYIIRKESQTLRTVKRGRETINLLIKHFFTKETGNSFIFQFYSVEI